MLIDKVKRGRLSENQKKTYRENARQLLVKANELFEANRNRLADEIRALKGQSDADSKARIRELEIEFATVRRVAPSIKEKIADTFAEGDAEYRKLLEAAAAEYLEMYDRKRCHSGFRSSAGFMSTIMGSRY